MNSCFRIALSGGPGGGKTTAADLFRREIGERIVIVPEAATLLFSGGFPRSKVPETAKCTQTAIYHVQKNLEELHATLYPKRMLLCDRGTIDGSAYWPGTPDSFFSSLGTSIESELKRYDAIVFFETAAAGGLTIEGGNRYRKESLEESLALDQRLRQVWEKHPHFVFIPHQESFIGKIQSGLSALVDVIQALRKNNNYKCE